MALAFTGDLLQMRTRLINMSVYSEEVGDSIGQIDAMLAMLGVQVVKRVESGNNDRSGPGPGWLGAGPGESLEFSEVGREVRGL